MRHSVGSESEKRKKKAKKLEKKKRKKEKLKEKKRKKKEKKRRKDAAQLTVGPEIPVKENRKGKKYLSEAQFWQKKQRKVSTSANEKLNCSIVSILSTM